MVPLRGIEAEKFCGRGRDKFDEAVGGEALSVDAAGVDEAQAVLDARAAVGNFREVVLAQFFLFLEAKRAMVGGDDLQRIVREPLPEFFLVPFFAQRRRENVFGALEAGSVHVFERKIEILRTSFGISGQAAVARLANFFERVVAGEMNDVDGRAGHFGQRNGARGGFGFGGRGPRQRVIFRCALAFRKRLLNDHVDRAAIFRVHADQAGVLGGLAHGAENSGVVEHEDAGIGHEEFEAGDAFAYQFAHLFELRGAEVGDDAVEGVVDDGFVVRLLHPGVKGLAESLPFVLDREIDQRGRAAEGRGNRAGLEIVGAGGAAEGHVQMGVNVDAARDDEQSRSVDHAPGVFGGQLRSDRGDLVSR